jgi:hypothetical protein
VSDLEDAASELYALAPEDFVAARTRLVKQARAAKDRALANDINALRKPTRTAWLVNALARDDPEALGALLDLGDRLREAQGAKDGAALRQLSAQRRRSIDALVRRAAALGEEAGHPPTEATTNEVAQTLQAALGDTSVAEQVRAGRLAGAAVYGGFGGPADAGGSAASGSSDDGGDLAALLAASMPAATKTADEKAADEKAADGKTAEEPGEPSAGDDAAERERQEAEQQEREQQERERRAALERARDEARQALDDAQDAADRATEEADRAAEELDRLREELARAEDAEREARAAARAARDEVRTRRTAADEAEQALRDADG